MLIIIYNINIFNIIIIIENFVKMLICLFKAKSMLIIYLFVNIDKFYLICFIEKHIISFCLIYYIKQSIKNLLKYNLSFF